MESFKVQLSFILLANAVNSALVTQMFPYVGLFIESFGIADRSSTGYYAGYLSTAFMVGRTISSSMWGWLTDHWGRKPSLVYSLWLVGLSSLGLGLSGSFAVALTFRFLTGFLNSLLVTAKTLVAEVCPEDYQAEGMAWQALTRLFGQVAGMLIGILPDPAFAQFFSGTVLADHPFFLPNALIALMCFISAIGSQIYLTETLHQEVSAKENQLATPLLGEAETPVASNTYLTLLADSTVLLILLIYSLTAAAHSGLWDLVPVWAWAKTANGGLEMSTKTIGYALASANVAMAVTQQVIFPKISQAKGYIWVFACNCLWSIPLTLLLPVAFYLLPYTVLFWVYFIATNCLCMLFYQQVFTVEFIMINNSVQRKQRGKMNGLAMTISSLTRSAASPVFTVLFAVTATSGYAFPLDFTCAFTAISIITLLSFILGRYLPQSIERSKDYLNSPTKSIKDN